jgi:hypothetical protein
MNNKETPSSNDVAEITSQEKQSEAKESVHSEVIKSKRSYNPVESDKRQ